MSIDCLKEFRARITCNAMQHRAQKAARKGKSMAYFHKDMPLRIWACNGTISTQLPASRQLGGYNETPYTAHRQMLIETAHHSHVFKQAKTFQVNK